MNDDEEFEIILERYLAETYRFIFGILQDEADAEDAAQETFVKVWKNIKKLDKDKNPKAWIFLIARNTAIDILRKKKDLPFSSLSDDEESFEENLPDPEPLPDEVFSKSESTEKLKEIISEMEPKYREVVLLHLSQNMTFNEISEITKKPLNTVKSQFRRALVIIRQALVGV